MLWTYRFKINVHTNNATYTHALFLFLPEVLGKLQSNNMPMITEIISSRYTQGLAGKQGVWAELDTGTSPGPVLPVFWTGSFLKTSCLDRQKFL